MDNDCKVDQCLESVHSRGFCKKHYSAWLHKRIDEDGYSFKKEVKQENQCRFSLCLTLGNKQNSLRKGLCNRHRKWAEKGIIDWNSLEILQPDRIPKFERRKTCKIESCSGKHKGLGFCTRHYKSYKIYNAIDIDGNRVPGKRKYYSLNDRCKIDRCQKGGRLVRGFCLNHYDQFTKEIISFEGYKLRNLKKITKYPEGSFCKGSGCRKKPRVNWFCPTCSERFKAGFLTKEGKFTSKKLPSKNKGLRCSEPSCNEEAHCQGLCNLHYNRMRTGYVGPGGYKNVGKTCTIDLCKDPAVGRSMCPRHYRQALRVEKGLPIRQLINKNKMCRVEHCHNKASSRLLCTSHYALYSNDKKILKDLSFRPVSTLKQPIMNYKTCIAFGCKQGIETSNLCKKHLSYFRTYYPDVIQTIKKELSCRVTGCFNKTIANKLCSRHNAYFREKEIKDHKWKNDRVLEPIFKKITFNKCKLYGCSNSPLIDGLCSIHQTFFNSRTISTEEQNHVQ